MKFNQKIKEYEKFKKLKIAIKTNKFKKAVKEMEKMVLEAYKKVDSKIFIKQYKIEDIINTGSWFYEDGLVTLDFELDNGYSVFNPYYLYNELIPYANNITSNQIYYETTIRLKIGEFELYHNAYLYSGIPMEEMDCLESLGKVKTQTYEEKSVFCEM